MDETRTYVLVVDDLPDEADSLAELLALWGYDPAARYGGAAALAACRARRPEAVLLDIGMPRMDGFEFVAHLRDLPGCERTPVVVVSGHADEAYQARGRELGIEQYLLKPADLTQLRALLGRLTAGPSAAPTVHAPRKRRSRLPQRPGAVAGADHSRRIPEAAPCKHTSPRGGFSHPHIEPART